MENPEKLAALGTKNKRRRKNKAKNTTHYVLDTIMRKQTGITQIRLEPFYKQLEVKTNRSSFLCGNYISMLSVPDDGYSERT
jgi:hypothetical protein